MTEERTQAPLRVVLRDAARGKWLRFTSPRRIVSTRLIEEVLPLVRRIEEGVRREGLYAAGFISYEAAPAFDAALPAKIDGEFPLLWFGLFEQAGEFDLPAEPAEAGPPIPWRPSVTHEEYRDRLAAIREYIRDGEIYQVNYTYRLRAKTDVDLWQLFLRIAGDEGAPYAAFVDTGEWAVCSASPELFLRIDGERIESRPMKGTAARGLWFEDDRAKRAALLSSKKERAENVMILDMVRNDLARVALRGSVHVPFLFEAEKYPTLWQMTSTVRARTHDPLDRILQATFPPASITGAPKRRSMEIIEELETSPRRLYTGTIGFMTPESRSQFNVAIRTVLLHKASGNVEYGVGGGIVWDSRPANEYEECLTKTKVLYPRARDFDLLETMLWSSADGCPLLEYHLKRLARSADYFDFRADLRQIRQELARIAAGLPPGPHRVRMLVSRRGNIRCEAVALDTARSGFGDVVLARNPIDKSDVFLYHKTTRRGVYEEARRMRPGSDDVLLFNEEGEITESTVANLAVEIEGMLWTPPVSCGLLPGTRRARMLDGGQLRERILTVRDVLDSPGVYLLNSVRGMHKVRVRVPED